MNTSIIDDAVGTRIKRKRKPSEKVLELQSERVNKTSKSSKSSRTKTKYLVDESNDPLQGDFPEVIEEYLEHGIMKCIAFNRCGTLLAEIEENEEYVEREDEFDLNSETMKVKGSDVMEDVEIDILTVEKDLTLSDSDMSQEKLCYLPASPCRDVPELEDKFLESSSYMATIDNSGSPCNHMMNHAASPVEGFSLNDFPFQSIKDAATIDIHDDIAISILSKLPIKSLMRFTCAKKSWPLLFQNPIFMKMFKTNFFISKHDDDNDSATHLVIIEHSGFPVQQSLSILSGERFEKKVSLDWPPPFQKDDNWPPSTYKILGSASVNGTLCLYRGYCDDFKIVLWNPGTKESKLIPSSFQPYENIQFDYCPLGFGYDCVTSDYKVIRKVYYPPEFEGGDWIHLPNTGDPFWKTDVHELDMNDQYWEEKKFAIELYDPFWEIYSLKRNSWRKLDRVDDIPVSYPGRMSLVNLNGFSHWLNQGPDMVSFDFRKETFVTTTLPTNSDIMHECTAINLVELNNSLSLITTNDRERYFDVWVLGELGVEESWTKFFVVGPLDYDIISSISVGDKSCIFFRDENGELGWYDFSTQGIEKIGLKRRSFPAQMAVYKENFFPFRGMKG